MTCDRRLPWFSVGLMIAVAVALYLIASSIVGRSISSILTFVPDDSLFYFKIASNFPETHRFSYDAIHDTYGFQPLWQLMLSGLAFGFDDRECFFRAGLLVLGILHILSGVLLALELRKAAGDTAALAASAYWLINPELIRWSLGGKENALYVVLLVCVAGALRVALSRRSLAPGRAFGLGALLGLTFLARVNSLLFVGLVLAFLAARGGWVAWGGRVRELLWVGAGCAVVCVPWLAYASATFGAVMPTSGVVKLAMSKSFVAEQWGLEWLSIEHLLRSAGLWLKQLARLARRESSLYLDWFLVAAFYGLSRGLAHRREGRGTGAGSALRFERTPVATVGALLLLWALLSSLVNAIYLPSYISYADWYAAPELLLLTIAFGVASGVTLRHAGSDIGPLLIGAVVGLLLRRPELHASFGSMKVIAGVMAAGALGTMSLILVARWRQGRETVGRLDTCRGAVTLQALVLVALSGVAAQWLPPEMEDEAVPAYDKQALYGLAKWTERNIPESAVLAAWDSGVLSYFSGRKVVSLEGLVSDLAFVRQGMSELPDYLERVQVEMIWGPAEKTADGRFKLLWLQEDAYALEWVPYPNLDLKWRSEPTYYVLARPKNRQGDAARMSTSAIAFGLAGRSLGRETPRPRQEYLTTALDRSRILARGADRVVKSVVSIAGDSREALFMHPPAVVEFPAFSLTRNSRLDLGMGILEGAWSKVGDGVEFSVHARPLGSERVTLLSRHLDPRRRSTDRRWIDGVVDLGRFAGQEVVLSLETASGPAGDENWDWAAWSRLVLSIE